VPNLSPSAGEHYKRRVQGVSGGRIAWLRIIVPPHFWRERHEPSASIFSIWPGKVIKFANTKPE
jgi:hypothetical protein